MNKAQLRSIYRQQRNELSPQQMNRFDDLLLINFQRLELGNITTVLSYQPLADKREVNTHLMVDYLHSRIPGLRLAYPVIDRNLQSFQAIEIDEETEYELNHYGITEPRDGVVMDPELIDLIFIPLLAFDTRGFRVGYGKGFYDRFLERCKPDVLKLGFSYFEAVDKIDDVHEYDVPLNICITPNRLYEF